MFNIVCFLLAVILPSLWLYVSETFDAEPWFFGVIFSSFMFSSLFSGPLFGLWVDCTHKTKSTILFANLFEMGGKLKFLLSVCMHNHDLTVYCDIEMY